MKVIKVVAAIIIDDGKVFATQRGYGEFKDGWEFPGGKIDVGETPEEALVREIKEELDTEVKVLELLDTVEYDFTEGVNKVSQENKTFVLGSGDKIMLWYDMVNLAPVCDELTVK